VLSGCDTGYRLAEVDEVLGCLVVQTVEHHEAEFERDLTTPEPTLNKLLPDRRHELAYTLRPTWHDLALSHLSDCSFVVRQLS